jgi:hypothetical protein
VLKKIEKSAYKLKRPDTWPAIHPVFNESYLSPHKPAQYCNQQKPPPPPPVDVKGEPEYNVEEIRDSKMYRGKIKYLVHWERYSTKEDTWEPIKNVENTQELIMKFHADHPNKPALPTIVIQHMHREAELKELGEPPKLYNYIDGIPGEGFIRPDKLPNINVIVPLNPQQAENLLRQPLDPLPHETQCIWIYETEPVNAITMAV